MKLAFISRKTAKKLGEVAEKMEENLVDVRREDVALNNFELHFGPSSVTGGVLMEIEQVSAFQKTVKIEGGPLELRKGSRVQVCGPNGIGKLCFIFSKSIDFFFNFVEIFTQLWAV